MVEIIFAESRNYISNQGSLLSDTFISKSGVPQSSIVGTLLFKLFINDVADNLLIAEVLIFADDIKLFLQISEYQDQNALQKDSNLIYTPSWGRKWWIKQEIEPSKIAIGVIRYI